MTGSLRAVETLSRVDPDFHRLVDVLYGGVMDPQELWEDVFAKRAPQMSPEERRKRTQRRVAQVSNAVGIAAGTAGLAEVARRPEFAGGAIGRAGRAAGRLVPRKVGAAIARHPKKAAVGALSLQAGNLGGDLVVSRVLGDKPKKKGVAKGYFEPVEKFGLPKPVARMKTGVLRFHNKRTAGVPGNMPSGGGGNVSQGTQRRWNTAGQTVGDLAGTPQRALMTAAGGGGLYAAGGYQQRKKDRQASQDPMAVGKRGPELTWSGEFSKFDEDKRLAFGWASVVEKDGMPVVDRQGDYIAPEDMETAAYVYVQKSRVGGDMHRRDHQDRAVHASDLVESVVFTKEKIAKMGLPASTPIGWWVGFKVHDDEVWEQVKKGGRTGFSIHGRGRRRETSIDDVMKEHR